MAKNYNIKTVSVQQSATEVTLGAVVPAGMTRYVTFISISSLNSNNTQGSRVYFCSGGVSVATTDASANAAQKMVIQLASATSGNNKSVAVPPGGPDTEHPLFTVASTAYLRSHLSTATDLSATVQVFVQYYDE
jgi:hypothetical protein